MGDGEHDSSKGDTWLDVGDISSDCGDKSFVCGSFGLSLGVDEQLLMAIASVAAARVGVNAAV